VAKTRGQVEKQKRETEKRKKIEKAVLKIAAGMPDDEFKQEPTVPITQSKATKDEP
jgi:hypothetical protein